MLHQRIDAAAPSVTTVPMRGQPTRTRRPRTLSALAFATAALLAESSAQSPHSAQHWAFVAPQKCVPAVRDASWCRDDLDRCVLAGLERDGLAPNAPAEPATLLRRAHLVLT